MTIKTVLFDFSGTLFHMGQDVTWVAHVTDAGGKPLSLAERNELVRKMAGPHEKYVTYDAEHQHAWYQRDLDRVQHRKVYLELLRQIGFHHEEQAVVFYNRVCDTANWGIYHDTEAALRILKNRGLSTAVISNIAYDIRPAFIQSGLMDYVDEFILSYEVSVQKPDPEIFQLALDKLGVAPEEALMIGDNPEADGAAQKLGCAFALVDALPVAKRPDALLTVLRTHGIA